MGMEARLCGHRTSQQGFAAPWLPVQQHARRRSRPQVGQRFRVLVRPLHRLLQNTSEHQGIVERGTKVYSPCQLSLRQCALMGQRFHVLMRPLHCLLQKRAGIRV